ncbi:MAG: hypothetical protein ACXQT5_02470 [Candidatus Syntropharchaeia archaeon]
MTGGKEFREVARAVYGGKKGYLGKAVESGGRFRMMHRCYDFVSIMMSINEE